MLNNDFYLAIFANQSKKLEGITNPKIYGNLAVSENQHKTTPMIFIVTWLLCALGSLKVVMENIKTQ